MPTPRRPAKLEHYREAQVARDYDQRWRGRLGARRNARKARAILRALRAIEARSGQPASVLDLPCGTGRFTTLLQQHGLEYSGADLSLPMLREARAHGGVRWLAADAARLPFPDRSFDLVLCIRFLHLVFDPALRRDMLGELGRVARQGVVVDYHHGHTVRIWGRHLRHRLGWLEEKPRNPSPSWIRGEVAKAGFEILDWIPVHRAPLLSDKVVLALRPTTSGPSAAD